MVIAMGLRVKSGVLMPSGNSSTNWVIITPGTLDFFLILTVKGNYTFIAYTFVKKTKAKLSLINEKKKKKKSR